jgi:hypothetical protein
MAHVIKFLALRHNLPAKIHQPSFSHNAVTISSHRCRLPSSHYRPLLGHLALPVRRITCSQAASPRAPRRLPKPCTPRQPPKPCIPMPWLAATSPSRLSLPLSSSLRAGSNSVQVLPLSFSCVDFLFHFPSPPLLHLLVHN